MINKTHQPDAKSWVDVPEGSDFPIQNLPYGIFSTNDHPQKRVGVAIGHQILDLEKAAKHLSIADKSVFSSEVLNDFMALGKEVHQSVRTELFDLLSEGNTTIDASYLVNQSDATLYIPIQIGDYTDFYSSEEHATNVGIMFRGKDNALMPNWKHIPVGYHGRASSIVVSGTDLHRPKGQKMPPNADAPVYGPSSRMDIELEMAFVVGKSTALGDTVEAEEAEDYIFGMMLFNDWSARDIQKWEYVPLGPFLGKNFGSTVSPWVVTMEALAPFRVAGPEQSPTPLPYLQTTGPRAFDIQLEVSLQPEGLAPQVICNSNFKYLYWSMSQQLAHQTVNGCNLNVGDMCASGTISGPTKDSFGSLLELTWNGTEPITLSDGSQRTFLEDNDTIIMKGWCEKDGLRIGFGEATGKILPSKK
ncbi:fumarylacetoacetase [Flammeovirga yaeyamensis]|uniref:fumarylacetoacetase n=1 Tax=Flammeovirga yaeyamensis TaxID=367791 RepID=A0AAX1N3G2_9BACT|nr:fumarylacetoacetase [Flammeovirga yaeyamensis]MBB3700647.1 fumarylacetoacetase [Flammeovirga yaeyamensis]NMF37761.1 fumarylacetoacetase [Flammeovirga yaeyamensis]QWG02069.1 fumarylacetoacetase [Flammeovirga yaeyamensis]